MTIRSCGTTIPVCPEIPLRMVTMIPEQGGLTHEVTRILVIPVHFDECSFMLRPVAGFENEVPKIGNWRVDRTACIDGGSRIPVRAGIRDAGVLMRARIHREQQGQARVRREGRRETGKELGLQPRNGDLRQNEFLLV
ncbi:hypothetical protein F5Y19DRAFT_187227 [Xylariaceae sp. FL1651]|nr:hypothetical protein F5Y19DRAFT_187227 [Xylariaceae sp. FL1651]